MMTLWIRLCAGGRFGHGGPDVTRSVPPSALGMSTLVTRLRHALLATLAMMTTITMDFTNTSVVPAPSTVSMESVDMRHVLKWPPPQAPCSTAVLYSVQFQGEFELTVLNGSWVEAPECQQTPLTHCDLTFDLGSDSDYNIHVRAQCGTNMSPWTKLHPPFNRRDTVLTAPEMSVTVVGDGLQVTFDKLPLTAVVNVTVWRRGEELQADVYMMPAEQMMLHVAALQEGAVYCVRAQTVLDKQLYSSSTDAQCVSFRGPHHAGWEQPTTVTVTVVITVGLLFAVFWSVVHCRSDACQPYFLKEPLPLSLQLDWDIQIPMSPEEAEICERVQMMPSINLPAPTR